MIQGTVAIIGRPNVGKSTLFNRMVRSRRAIVDDIPGVTRDRIYGKVDLDEDDKSFFLIDTGGFETDDFNFQPFEKNVVWEQTQLAISEADLILMVLDGKSGLQPHDKWLTQYLKKTNKEVIFVANKVDGPEQKPNIFEFYELGLSEIETCSAAHNRGVFDLVEVIGNKLAEIDSPHKRAEKNANGKKIAIIGKPNVGKSSILNRISGEDRAIVSDIAGTTRDNIDTPITFNKKPYLLIDTAGIRRRTKIDDRLEGLSVIRSLRNIEEADIVIMVISAIEGVNDQDARLIQLAISKYKPVLLIVNKWDLIENKDSNTLKEYEARIRHKLKDISYIPILFVSCLQNQRVHKLMNHVEDLVSTNEKRIPTSRVNEVMAESVRRHTPKLIKKYNKRVKFYFASQVSNKPPTFVIMCNVANEIQEAYKRYMVHRFRRELGFHTVPLKIIYRGKKEQNQKKAEEESYVRL